MEKNTEKDRMVELLRSFSNTKENIKESNKIVDQSKLTSESIRMKNLADGNVNENFYGAGSAYATRGYAQTVNTIVADTYNQKEAGYAPNLKSEFSKLTDSEALEIAFKRTLASGSPINNISFYDEINWNLQQLGYPTKNALDIKTAISKLIAQ